VKIRVHEGLEGLRKFFARKGIALGAVALASGLASEATASEPTLVATCVQTVLTPGAAPGAAALAHGVITVMIIKTATLAATGLVLVGSCLTAALVVGAEPVPPVTQPVTQPVMQPVTQTMPALQITAASMNVSMAPDRPSAMVEPRIVYEAVRLDCSRLNYSLAALAGVPRPVLSTADFLGGPDDRVYFDSSASLLPQMAFKGVMRPRTLNVRRAEPDPAYPDEVRFRAEAVDLNEVAGIFATPAGPRRHAAWADRAILMFVCAIDAKASNGLGNPRMESLHIYGRSQPERRATILRLKPGAPPEPSQVDPIIAAHTYEMRASGAVISIYFDAAGQMQNIEGVEDFESDGLVPMRGPNRPAIKE
jgi:hypothetical protein